MSLDVKTIAIVSVTMAAFLCPLSGFSAYPTMDRAMELFGTNRISTMGVSFEAEAYSEFARDLRCQTTPESARVMETFLLNSVTSIVVTVSTNNVNDGTRAWLLYDRGCWFSEAARNFYDLPTNSANCIAVATYLGGVHKVEFPTNLLRNSSCSLVFFSPDPAQMEAYNEKCRVWRSAYDLQFRVRDSNEAVDEYRRDLLSICNVGVRGCRGIMDDAQFCTFTNQLATASNASAAERRILFDSIP